MLLLIVYTLKVNRELRFIKQKTAICRLQFFIKVLFFVVVKRLIQQKQS